MTLIALGVGVIFFNTIAKNLATKQLIPQLEQQLTTTLKRPVSLGTIEEISLGRIRLQHSQISGLARVRTTELTFNPWDVLKTRPIPVNIELTAPELRIRQRAQGTWELAELLKFAPNKEAPLIQVARVKFIQGKIEVVPNRSPAFTVTSLMGEAKSSRATKINFTAQGNLEQAPVKVQGEILPEQKRTDMQVQLTRVPIAKPLGILHLKPTFDLEGLATGAVLLHWDGKILPRWDGQLRLEDGISRIAGLPQPIRNLSGPVILQNQDLQTPGLRGRYGQLDITAQGSLNNLHSLDLSLRSERLALTSIQNTFGIKLPVPVVGSIRAEAGVTGPLTHLMIKGRAIQTTVGQIDRLPLTSYQTPFQLDVPKKLLTFPDLQLGLLGGRVAGRAQVDLTRQTLAFQGAGTQLQAQEAWLRYGGTAAQSLGILTVKIDTQGSFQALQSRVQWQLAGGGWPGRGQLAILGNHFDLTQTTFTKYGGQIAVDGTLAQNRWQAQIQPKGLRLEQIKPGLAIAGVPVFGSLDGKVQALGDWGKFALAQVRAQGQVSLPQGVGLVKTTLANHLAWDGQKLTLSDPLPQPLQVTGTVALSSDLQIPQWDLQLTSRRFPLSALYGLKLPLTFAGLATTTTYLSGNPTHPRFQGTGVFENLQSAQISFPTLTGDYHWQPSQARVNLTGQASRVDVALINNQPSQIVIQRNQTLLTGLRQGDDLVGKLANFSLPTVVALAQPQWPIGLVAGQVSGDYRWRLRGATQASGHLSFEQARFSTLRASSAEAEFRYQSGRWEIPQAQVILADQAGSYRFSGSWQPNNNRIKADLMTQDATLEGLRQALGIETLTDIAALISQGLIPYPLGTARDVRTVARHLTGDLANRLKAFEAFMSRYEAQTPGRAQDLSTLRGAFQGRVQVKGQLTNPQVTFNLNGQNWQWESLKLATIQSTGSLRNQTLGLDQFQVALAGQRERKGSFQGTISPDRQQGVITIQNFPANLSRFFLPPNLKVKGDASLQAKLSGTRANPILRGDFEINNGFLNRAALKQASGGLSYREARLSLLDVRVATSDEPAYINGSFPLPVLGAKLNDDRVRMQVNIKNQGLGLLNLFTDQVVWQDGEGEVNLQIGGTTDALLLQGTLQLKAAQMKLTGFADPLTNLNANVIFQRDRAQITQLDGNFSGGRITAEPGYFALLSRTADQLAPLALNLDRLNIRLPSLYEGEARGQLLLDGTLLAPTFGGKIILENGRFSLPDTTKKKTVVFYGPPDPQAETASVQRITSPELNGLEVILGDRLTLVQIPVFRVDTRGKLLLRGTLDAIQPEGEVEFLRGRLNLFPTPFYLDSSYNNVARFRPELGLNPELNLVATARVNEVTFLNDRFGNTAALNNTPGFQEVVRVEARVTGRALKPELNLSSSPPRAQADIVALLGGGSAGALLNTGASFVTSPLFNPVEEFVLETLSLDEFRIGPTTRTIPGSAGAIALGIGLEVGKDINRQFSLSISQSLTDPSQLTRLNIRYRLTDSVQLRLGTDFSRDVTASIDYETQF